MSQIAIDAALLPEMKITRLAIEINRKLIEASDREIVLDEATCLPHISLAMGCIESEQVDAIREAMATTVEEYPVGELTVTGVVTVLNTRGEPSSMFAIAKTPALQTVHERIMEAIEPYVTRDVHAKMMFGNEETAQSTLGWIRDYREKAAFAAFFPHITIGYGEVREPTTFPIPFVTPELALCHLGNHCTCRKVLAAVPLSK